MLSRGPLETKRPQRFGKRLILHVQLAKEAGPSRREVISAILVGLLAAGHIVTQVLPVTIEAYDKG